MYHLMIANKHMKIFVSVCSTGCLEEVCRLTWSGCVQPLAAAECPWNGQVWVCASGTVTITQSYLQFYHRGILT
jgi:hypothetical protein